MKFWKRWIRKLLLPLCLVSLLRGRAGLGRRPWRNGILLAAALSAAGWGSGYGWHLPAPQVLTAEVSRADLEDVVLASGVLRCGRWMWAPRPAVSSRP